MLIGWQDYMSKTTWCFHVTLLRKSSACNLLGNCHFCIYMAMNWKWHLIGEPCVNQYATECLPQARLQDEQPQWFRCIQSIHSVRFSAGDTTRPSYTKFHPITRPEIQHFLYQRCLWPFAALMKEQFKDLFKEQFGQQWRTITESRKKPDCWVPNV